MGDNQGTKIWWDVADTNNDNGQRTAKQLPIISH